MSDRRIFTNHQIIKSNNNLQHQSDCDARELLVFQAQLSESAGRFEEMAETMKELCQNFEDLTVDERNLLSCAYKNVIGSRRTSCRILQETLDASKSPSNGQDQDTLTTTTGLQYDNKTTPIASSTTTTTTIATKYNLAIIKSLMSNIESEIRAHCNDIIELLCNHLLTSISATGESKVFYYKMKGDYLRYLCETCTNLERKEKANESLLAYKTASDKAMIELPPTHPVRLGLMLNFSVFYYEIMKSPERSCRLAKQAFDDAIAELDTLSEESYRDSTIIMQLLRDNLNLWESEQILQPYNDNLIQQHQQQHQVQQQ